MRRLENLKFCLFVKEEEDGGCSDVGSLKKDLFEAVAEAEVVVERGRDSEVSHITTETDVQHFEAENGRLRHALGRAVIFLSLQHFISASLNLKLCLCVYPFVFCLLALLT